MTRGTESLDQHSIRHELEMILVSDGKFSLGKNDEVNSLKAWSAPQAETPSIKTNSLETPAIKNHKTNSL